MDPYRLVRQVRVAFWSPYIAYLYATRAQERTYWKRWYKQTLDGFSPIDARIPFMPFRTMEWLEEFLAGGDKRIFEWGSGGSTLFFASRAREVYSVEHDPRWFELVSMHLARNRLHHCHLNLVRPHRGPASSQLYGSGRMRNWFFEDYARAIDAYSDDYFDLVVVDGRARPACIEHGKNKVRPGGVLLLDDSNRPRYHEAVQAMDKLGWQKLDLSGIRPGGPAIHFVTAWIRPED